MIANTQPSAQRMDAYERVLGDAMADDATLSTQEEYVEQAWRIIEPLLQKPTCLSVRSKYVESG